MCSYCDYKTTCRGHYTRHRLTCIKPFSCTLNDRCRHFRFSSLEILAAHLRVEHGMHGAEANKHARRMNDADCGTNAMQSDQHKRAPASEFIKGN